MAIAKSRFDVKVAFPEFSFGIKSRKDVELTPLDVADELEKICTRIRTISATSASVQRTTKRSK